MGMGDAAQGLSHRAPGQSESSERRSTAASKSVPGAQPSWLRTRLGEGADDEVVRVFDQVAHELVGKAAVERDRVPVAFVEVIAGADRWIGLA
jgi:hypothetical protein